MTLSVIPRSLGPLSRHLRRALPQAINASPNRASNTRIVSFHTNRALALSSLRDELQSIEADMVKSSAPARTTGRGRKRATNEYEDDGFVVSEEGGTHTLKKARKEKVEGKQRDNEGNDFWEITAQRRVTVSDFKGQPLISIREYYEKDGVQLPGRKGISLNLEQYNTLMGLLPEVEATLTAKGEIVARPHFDGEASGSVKQEDGSDEGKDTKQGGKKNFEATSDEDNE